MCSISLCTRVALDALVARPLNCTLGDTVGVIAWFRKQRQWQRDHFIAFSAVVQTQADGLTLFQRHAISAVGRFVSPESFQRSAMGANQGDYLSAPLGRNGAELYIYPNEAAILGAKPYAWFEEWDYRTPDELLEALVEECTARVA
jgi:hypothetical protein